MSRFYIAWLPEEWSWDIWINGSVRWKVEAIIYLLLLYAIVLPIIFLSYLLELDDTDIYPFLHL